MMSGYEAGGLERVSRTTYTPVQDWQKVPTFDQVLMKDPAVARWWTTAGPVCARLRGVPERLMALLKERRDAINALALDDGLSSKGRFDKELALKNAALQAIDQVSTDAKEDVEQLERLIDQATAEVPGEPVAELLKEMQLQRCWQRASRLLDSMSDVGAALRQVDDLAQDAAKAGDKAMLAALRQELPSYLASRRMQGPVGGILTRIAELESPFVPAVTRAARQTERQAQVGWQRITAAINQAREECHGKGKTVVLPGWLPNERIEF